MIGRVINKASHPARSSSSRLLLTNFSLFNHVRLHNHLSASLSTVRLKEFIQDPPQFKLSRFQQFMEARFEKKQHKQLQYQEQITQPNFTENNSELDHVVLAQAIDKLFKLEDRRDSHPILLLFYSPLIVLGSAASFGLIGISLPYCLLMKLGIRIPPFDSIFGFLLYLGIIFKESIGSIFENMSVIREKFIQFKKPLRVDDVERCIDLIEFDYYQFTVPELTALAKAIELYYPPSAFEQYSSRTSTKRIYSAIRYKTELDVIKAKNQNLKGNNGI